MSSREQKYQVALYATLGISPLHILITSPGETLLFRAAVGQQQEDQQNASNSTVSIFSQTSNIENQSSAFVGFTQNQITNNQTGTAALSANLTQMLPSGQN